MDMFKHSDKVFVAEDNRNYIGELPHHLAHKGVPRQGARQSQDGRGRILISC